MSIPGSQAFPASVGQGRLELEVRYCVGGVVSPLLANLYLDELDEELTREGFRLVRYADDFVVLARDVAEARKAREAAHFEDVLCTSWLSKTPMLRLRELVADAKDRRRQVRAQPLGGLPSEALTPLTPLSQREREEQSQEKKLPP